LGLYWSLFHCDLDTDSRRGCGHLLLIQQWKEGSKSLATINFAKQQPVPLSTDRVGLLNTNVRHTNMLDATDDPLRRDSRTVLDLKSGKDDENEVDPAIFEEIYKQLRDHAAYVKEEFEKKAEVDKENISKVWGIYERTQADDKAETQRHRKNIWQKN
jgi:hypothetical protein